MDHQLYATCPNELTGLLAQEVSSLGGTAVRTAYRAVYFTGSTEVGYRVNLHSRLASRICRVLKIIPAQSPAILFDKARRIRFHELFSPERAVSIQAVSSGDEAKIPNHLIGSKLREAINDCFTHHAGVMPNQSSRDADVRIVGYYHRGRLMVSIDTSRESLHQRGFRVEGHPAPLKETLAAALLAVCEYDGTVSFFDPMCGSGTIAVEAAQLAINRAPNLLRKKGGFGLEHLHDFDAVLWQAIRDEARAAVRPAPAEIFASDIDPRFVEIAQATAGKARLQSTIHFECRDFFRTEKPAETGLLIANIPYGERMAEMDVTPEFLQAVGDHLKNHFQGWRCGILAPTSSPLKAVGLKPHKQAPFLNGTLPVTFAVYDVY